ncbi:MAG: DUF4954 domain-containing protein [Treponema sp. CETP13]|nr:MAG: DUF4954 domain-containing protein [Treponema sp. CETP13]
MSKVQYIAREPHSDTIPALQASYNRYFPSENDKKGFRHPNAQEIKILEANHNSSTQKDWSNLFVTDIFDPNRIWQTRFVGESVIGNLSHATLQYHDLVLETGIYNSFIVCCVIGNDVCIRDVHYLANYRIGNRVILFNIQEMSCTSHSKFGNGWLKADEPEKNRIWIEIGNENGKRKVLPFEDMIPADAYIWSRNRSDTELQKRFIELAEFGNDKITKTSGIVFDDAVIKNTSLIKDAKIGSCAYIKGAFKLKNITVLSNEDSPSQIGEGVEMVNGIMGYGSKAFYQTVAVRFILGKNCQIKYGARLLNTVLGDNSTVSCCELLNNLIFPFHEQHHNSSFLIASTIGGQSNIASGATIGSNHNSRSPDGEILAKRGFWPGLCSDFKHNCKFASFSLIAKGSYPYELNITYPFSLIATNGKDKAVTILPAYWFQYNMFAIVRNNSKFIKRDKRVIKSQHIETDPLAPDTIQEILYSLDRIITLTSCWLKEHHPEFSHCNTEVYQCAKDYLHQHPKEDLTLYDGSSMKKHGAIIIKAAKGYKEYRKIVKYFAVRSIIEFCKREKITRCTTKMITAVKKIHLYTKWENVGGQIIPQELLERLSKDIKSKKINNWQEVHAFYDFCESHYAEYKVRYALYLLEFLYSQPIEEFDKEIFKDIKADVLEVSNYMYNNSISSRQKDYTDYFRTITFENKAEMDAVLGKLEDNTFLHELKKSTLSFNANLETFFAGII